jgi:hypothetical protein
MYHQGEKNNTALQRKECLPMANTKYRGSAEEPAMPRKIKMVSGLFLRRRKNHEK